MKIHRGNFESNIAFLNRVPFLETPKRILEIGSGRGAMVRELLNRGHQVTGTEVSSEYSAYAHKEYQVELVPISTETTKLPFGDQSFDVVVSFDVFEHIPDTEGHIQEVRRILAPGGRYLLATPNKWTNIPFEIIKERSFTKYKEYHCSLHTYWALRRRFEQAGFAVTFVAVPLVTPFFLEKMRKYFGSFGILLVKVLRPDSWPQWLKTNFYIIAEKKD